MKIKEFFRIERNVVFIGFIRFEEIAASNGQQDNDDEEEEDDQTSESDGIFRSTRKKKAPREHVRIEVVC